MKKSASIWDHLENYKVSIILAVVGIILIGLGLMLPRINFNNPKPAYIPVSENKSDGKELKVDVAGAVFKPAVYSLEENTRVADAISAAGGFTDKADKVWIAKNLNLAQPLSDGVKIYVPAVGEVGNISNKADEVLGEDSNKVNINTASTSELDTLPNIGPVRAEKIINNRPYSSLEDLKSKNVLGPSTFEKIKDLISVF
ncbi:MAG: hypothetical protein A2134_00205 [Candidatus Woykebacteria bacterium RBG_16_39_9b]|uniref:Soluble ligand binding domain-containing protein n=1 Tax=Candidatus Woykebacteria bacterium RBG_16_39_9b TaxID=1802595 RepID=A0A1G1WDP7_9BACT|nr:MAG: hypothetical protein A2134_00205 [Candidatus Woykebacteria bacterium RBG_16_39_9b]